MSSYCCYSGTSRACIFILTWLNEEAEIKVPARLVILDTSHFEMSWLKALAPLKVFARVVIESIDHLLMSWLKCPENADCILVTRETSQ